MSDPATLAFYDRQAADYAERRGQPDQARLNAFAARLAPGARVLDLGCGGGQDSAALLARGFRVTSVDLSAGLAAEAKRRWNIEVRQLSFSALDYAATFEGVWASASLHHAQSATLPDIFARVHRALTPSGLFHASFKVGADRRDTLGRFYSEMNAVMLAQLVASRAAWREPEIVEQDGTGHDDVSTQWLVLDVQRV